LKPDDLRGTRDFASFLQRLDRNCYLYRIIDNGLNVLRNNILAGAKVERRLWPKNYVREFQIRNLFVLDLDSSYRLTYTVIADGTKKVVCVLECMDHSEYERRFGYS